MLNQDMSEFDYDREAWKRCAVTQDRWRDEKPELSTLLVPGDVVQVMIRIETARDNFDGYAVDVTNEHVYITSSGVGNFSTIATAAAALLSGLVSRYGVQPGMSFQIRKIELNKFLVKDHVRAQHCMW